MSALDIQQRFGLNVWPANRQWCARSGTGNPVEGATPEEAIRAWAREDVIAKMRACNPASEILDGEIAEFRSTGRFPERWRGD